MSVATAARIGRLAGPGDGEELSRANAVEPSAHTSASRPRRAGQEVGKKAKRDGAGLGEGVAKGRELGFGGAAR